MCSPISLALVDCDDALLAAVTEVAERSLFAVADASDQATFEAATRSPLTDGGSDWLRACVHFKGSIGGRFEVTLPAPLARHLCASFIGAATADEIDESNLADFTGELANMICGTWLTRACRREAFKLTPPRVRRGHVDGAEPGDGATEQFYLSIDEAPIRLALHWEVADRSGQERRPHRRASRVREDELKAEGMREPVIAVVPEELVRGIKQLEPLPVTAQRLLSLLNGEDVSLASVAELIEFDQAIVAAVLRAASTVRHACYSTPTVREAVVRLGTVALLDLVLEGYLKKLRGATPMYDLSEQDLWLHGAAAQLAVRALAVERPRARIPAIAETAALLHDVGKLIVSRYLKADVRELVTHANTRGITFVEAEQECLGVDHAAVGAAMAEAWHFPTEIVDAIRRHHSAPFTNPSVVLDAVALANVVAKTIATGLGAEGLNFAVDPGSYRRLGVDFATFGRVCLQADAWLRPIARAQGVSL